MTCPLAAATPPGTPPEVAPEEAKGLLEDGAVIVDVREAWELEQLRVPHAVHIPLPELPARIQELPSDRTIVCMCKSGARSQHAVRMLAACGYKDVLNLAGGIIRWHHAGLPTARSQ